MSVYKFSEETAVDETFIPSASESVNGTTFRITQMGTNDYILQAHTYEDDDNGDDSIEITHNGGSSQLRRTMKAVHRPLEHVNFLFHHLIRVHTRPLFPNARIPCW